jgi:hypothetical protein
VGTLTLTGANTHMARNHRGRALQIGDGGTTGFIGGNITDQGPDLQPQR